MREKTEAELLHRMAAYCSASERCVQDVTKKLTPLATPEVASRIITRLIQESFIDEARFCRSFVNDKWKFNKWGRLKISYELKRKNIPDELIEEALAGIDIEAYNALLVNLMRDKRKTTKGKDAYAVSQKLYRFGLSRGFTVKEITIALKKLDAALADEANFEDILE
ncbi:RecX family transcriptional regulator [Parabacteroides sp. OttesenSCG-928-G21]|nr:RecX family transcriptional regulator [Parabacteroides sp. OttesenSCG-928-G21]